MFRVMKTLAAIASLALLLVACASVPRPAEELDAAGMVAVEMREHDDTNRGRVDPKALQRHKGRGPAVDQDRLRSAQRNVRSRDCRARE